MSRLIAVEAIGSPDTVLNQRVVALPERLFDLLPAACVCDRYGLILRYNRRAAELWGHAPSLAIRLNLSLGQIVYPVSIAVRLQREHALSRRSCGRVSPYATARS
jgi:hypothetical protein